MSQDKKRLWHIGFMTIREGMEKRPIIFPSIDNDLVMCAYCGKEIPVLQAVGTTFVIDGAECVVAISFCSGDCQADFQTETYENDEKYYKFMAITFSQALAYFYRTGENKP